MAFQRKGYTRAAKPEDIKAQKLGIEILIMKQIDRINELISNANVLSMQGSYFTARIVPRSIHALESMMTPTLTDTYKEEAEEYKKLLIGNGEETLNQIGVDGFVAKCNQWYALVCVELQEVGLFPIKEIEYEDDFNWE